MKGILVYVMGPSGSGKDSLMDFARREMDGVYQFSWRSGNWHERLRPLVFARRHITRPADSGGENHVAMSENEFIALKEQNLFALDWESHGLRYGIHRSVDRHLQNNAVVVVNGSRNYLPTALQRYPALVPVLVSVRPEVLAARLYQRQRESAAEIRQRLAQACTQLPSLTNLITIDNSGDLLEAGRAFVNLLHSLRCIK